MQYKALVSFAGVVSASAGQVINIDDKAIAADLLRAGYVEQVKPTRNQGGKKDANQGT